MGYIEELTGETLDLESLADLVINLAAGQAAPGKADEVDPIVVARAAQGWDQEWLDEITLLE